MKLTFLGNRYETETPIITDGTSTCTTAKYRGIEYKACTTTVSSPMVCARKYRGITY